MGSYGASAINLAQISGIPRDVLTVVVTLGVAAFIARWAGRLIRKAFGGSTVGSVSIVVNIVRAVIAVAAVSILAENVFDIHVSGVAQALGVSTLVVSLGLQDLIKNVVAGVQIVMAHIFTAGDQLEVGNVRGEVVDVNWRQTVLRDRDGDMHVVPNASLMSATFMRREGAMARRYDFLCDIKPGLDLDRVAADIEQLADTVLDERELRAEEHSEVRFLGSTANGVTASVRIFLKDIQLTTRGYDAVMRAIGQRGYLADWTNESPDQAQWR